jgi:hypothetical protein
MSTPETQPAEPKPEGRPFQNSLWTVLGVRVDTLAVWFLFGDLLVEWFANWVRFMGKILR